MKRRNMNTSNWNQKILAALSYDARMALMALMWMGRERDEIGFNEAVKYAENTRMR